MDNGFISLSIYVRCWDPENFPWGFGLQWGFGLGGLVLKFGHQTK